MPISTMTKMLDGGVAVDIVAEGQVCRESLWECALCIVRRSRPPAAICPMNA
jgi:hypothetical protein